jgi:alpha-1,3-rhamnosyl/mannosyltransferase
VRHARPPGAALPDGDPVALRVGIDGRAFASPAAGVRRYVAGLTAALARHGEVELVALGGDAAEARARGLGHEPAPPHPPTNLGWVGVGLPWAAARAGVEVLHAPAYTAPPIARMPVVVTIHDVSYARHPEWYPYRRDRLRRAFYAASARGAAHVLTDSEFSAGEIGAAYGLARDRVTVAPLGVDLDRFGPGTAPAGAERSDSPVGRRPYVLHVGDLHARRNLEVVVEALLALRRDGGRPPALVLAGTDRGAGDALLARAAQAGAPDLVARLGMVDDGQLLALYRSALALVYPSRYEGFGLPVAEALACGLPVVGSAAASIPEVLGDAGLLVDPDDADGWARALDGLSRDAALRARLAEAGRKRAAGFTWARTAGITAAVYRRVAARGRA